MCLSTRAASHGYSSGLAAGASPLIFGGGGGGMEWRDIDLVGAGGIWSNRRAEATRGDKPVQVRSGLSLSLSLELIRHG